MMDSTCIVKCFIFHYCIIHSIMLLLIPKCYIYAFCMLCICLIVYHFVHNIILIILAHFYIFRLFLFPNYRKLFALLLYFCNLYVQNYHCRIISC